MVVFAVLWATLTRLLVDESAAGVFDVAEIGVMLFGLDGTGARTDYDLSLGPIVFCELP